TDVFGEGAVAAAEDLVAGRQVRPLRTDPLHDAREVDPEDRLLRAAQPEQRANEIRLASHVVPVVWVHRSRVHAYEHAVRGELGLLDVADFEPVRRAVTEIDDRLHATAITVFARPCPVERRPTVSGTSSSAHV